ncbi:hypothetical protein DLD77_05435 [Chitinophaga alhagiae]|uniref:Polysaccharide biosynthesis protein C-terminal domain-containing protein n=1 Tax=Chitinophaga alhagiae TaxID=2203219 RepID=A0ABN5LP77_9BACT|nr:oligosaccharide flippase family protein [Chitinophaga alhagiae]AWO01171.1 hypothetical protein DLD77_05435 [Chitinophaga alhagiae]
MSLKKNFLIYGLGNMLYTAVVLLLVPIYLEKLNITDYGLYSIFYVTGNLLSVLFSLSVSNGILRYFSEYSGLKERKEAVSSLLVIFFLIFLVIAGLTFAVRAAGFNVLEAFKLPDNPAFISLMLTWAFSRILFNMILGVLRANNESIKYVILSISDVLSLFLINYFIIYHTAFAVEHIFWGYTISSLLSVLTGSIFIARYFAFRLHQPAVKYLVTYGMPLSIANTISYLISYGNRYFLLYFTSEREVAIFDVAQKITGILGIVLVNGFMIAFTPYYLSLHQSATALEFNSKINLVLAIFTRVFFFMGGGVIVADHYFLSLLSKPEYLSSSFYTPFLIMANAFNVLFMLLAMTTNIHKRTSIEMFITCIMLIMGMSANLLLIPLLGMIGCAISQIIMTFAGFIAINIYNKRNYPLNYQLKPLVVSIFIFIAVTVSDYFIVRLEIPVSYKLLVSALALALSGLQFLPSLPGLKATLQSFTRNSL